MHTPADIVRGCKANDRKSQYLLYEHYSAKLLGICMRYTDRREDAHDVLQEAFIRIFAKLPQLKDPDMLEPWLRKVAVSAAINHFHQNKKHALKPALDTVMFKVASHAPDGLEILNKEELLKLVNSLPAGYRMVFNLFVIEGYSHKEIAEMLNIAEGTSKSQLNHAKIWLQQQMGGIRSTLPKTDTESAEVSLDDLIPAIND